MRPASIARFISRRPTPESRDSKCCKSETYNVDKHSEDDLESIGRRGKSTIFVDYSRQVDTSASFKSAMSKKRIFSSIFDVSGTFLGRFCLRRNRMEGS